ncbi:FecR family protein [Gaoshiqia sp. Z1-71]|uniref:FecR family protein n=1 Tax=Gaoshiqia hydrogeniformans TaxID=3290090 RepID=UPI003BF8690E
MWRTEKQDWDFSDLLLDDSFVEQVNDPLRSKAFIEELKDGFPGKTDEIEMAVNVLRGIKNKRGEYLLPEKQNLWNRITGHQPRLHKLWFLRIASGILLIIGLSAIVALMRGKEDQIDRVAGNFASDTLVPGLMFSDGRQVAFSGEHSSVSYSSDGARVEINDSAQISQDVKADVYNQLVVPYGKNASLVLSDGTKVWVHSGSRLVYPPVFNGKNREVYLYGEAYFEVTSNSARPFIVKTDHFSTRVYGTRFVVQAYKNENLYSTILLEGNVRLSNKQSLFRKEVALEPNQKGSVSVDDGTFDVNRVEYAENYISWIHNHLNFDNEKLDQLLGRVARYYNILIELPESVPPKVISGKLDLKSDPERVLRGIAVLANLRLAVEEGGYKLYKK